MLRTPDFLVLGAHKAGSSSLYAYLKQHPQIYMSPIKELGFFNCGTIAWEHLVDADLEQSFRSYPLDKTLDNVILDNIIHDELFVYQCYYTCL